MSTLYAREFSEIVPTLAARADLREAILTLVDAQPMSGKVTEGGDRLARFREILKELVAGQIDLAGACRKTEEALPRAQSVHAGSNKVFADGWAERLVRTQYSRFYNQAVMEELLAAGQTECFIPHSSEEDRSSPCSVNLAGNTHDLKTLYDRLVAAYAQGNWGKELRVPNHPHCTHVITPVE